MKCPKIFRIASTYSQNFCNIVPGDSLTSLKFRRKRIIFYRIYATLYVMTIVDETENSLAILDIIHTFVEVWNGCCKYVSEVQLAFHSDKAL
jgi:AP-3 complex subunit sigma